MVILLSMYGCENISESVADQLFKKEVVTVPDIHPEKDYAFAVLGDNRPDTQSLEYFLGMIRKLEIDTVYHVGDIVEFNSPLFFMSVKEAIQCCFDLSHFNLVVGNHDLDGSSGNSMGNLEVLRYFFEIQAERGYRTQETNDGYFVFLNSYLPGYENEIDDTQLAWLEDTLNAIDTTETPSEKPIFVFLHHPMFPAGYHAPLINRDSVHNVLKQHHITAVFQGHEHLYYKEVVDDIPYYVTGGAGSSLHDTEEGMAIHHFLAVSVSPNFQVDIVDTNGDIVE